MADASMPENIEKQTKLEFKTEATKKGIEI